MKNLHCSLFHHSGTPSILNSLLVKSTVWNSKHTALRIRAATLFARNKQKSQMFAINRYFCAIELSDLDNIFIIDFSAPFLTISYNSKIFNKPDGIPFFGFNKT